MPRANFREIQKGFGFQEGFVRIDRSVAVVYQYPPNRETKEQSEPFIAMSWEYTSLDSEWNVKGDEDEQQNEPIIIRMGDLSTMRPGKLDPKDFDNMDVLAEDLGSDVGTEGNTFFWDADAKFNRNWGALQASLEACAFKPEILKRGIATDFEGMVLHLKTEEGQKYIAKRGRNAGKEVTPTNLVCDRIHVYPYDAKKETKAATKAATKTTTAATKPTNGKAEVEDVLAQAVLVFVGDGEKRTGLSAKFRADVPAGKG